MFGAYDDVLALSGHLSDGMVNDAELYKAVANPLLQQMLAALHATVNSMSYMTKLYKKGKLKFACMALDSALSLDAQRTVTRGQSPWIYMREFPDELKNLAFHADSGAGVSWSDFGAVYGTPLFAFACIMTKVYLNAGIWRPAFGNGPLERPTAARGVLAMAMRRLGHLFFGTSSAEDGDWISLLFALSGAVAVYGTLRDDDDGDDDDDDMADFGTTADLLDGIRNDPNITESTDGDVTIFTFRPNAGVPVLDDAFPPMPTTVAEIEQNGIDVAALADQLPPYASPADRTDVPVGNRPGSALRTAIRSEAGLGDPSDLRDV